MTYQEKFLAWQSKNPSASKDTQRKKLLEFKSGSENIARAKDLYADQPEKLARIEAMEKGELPYYSYKQTPASERRTFLGKPMSEGFTRGTEAAFPRVVKAQTMGENFAPFSGAADALSAGGRSLEAGMYGIATGEDPISRMGDITSKKNMASEILRSPELPLSAIGGNVISTLARGKSLLPKSAILAGGGALSQIPFSTFDQLQKMETGQDINPSQIGVESGVSGALSLGSPAASKLIRGTGKLVRDVSGSVLGASGELLSELNINPILNAFKKTEKIENPNAKMNALNSAVEGAESLAEKIVDDIDNFENRYIIENPQVMEAVEKMGNIDLNPVYQTLQNLKKESQFEKGSKFYNDINNYIDDIQMMFVETGENLPAENVLKMRRELDKAINYSKNLDNPTLNNALEEINQEVSGKLRKLLVEAANKTGNKQYVSAMKKMSDKYKLHDEMKKIVGGGAEFNRKQRAYNLLDKMSKESNVFKSRVLKNYSDITGKKNLASDAKMLQLAKQWEKAKNMTGAYDVSPRQALTQRAPVLEAASALTGAGQAIGAGIEGIDKFRQRFQPALIRSLYQGE